MSLMWLERATKVFWGDCKELDEITILAGIETTFSHILFLPILSGLIRLGRMGSKIFPKKACAELVIYPFIDKRVRA